MASETDIANLALSKLGDAATITTLSEETEPARAIRAVFALMRQAVLRAHPWNFAMARAALPALATPPAFGYARAFALPEAPPLLRLWRVVDSDDYTVEGRTILTDASAPLAIIYIADVADSGRFDALFTEALACRIAAQVARRLTGSTELRTQLLAEYRDALAEARRIDGQETPPSDVSDDDWWLAREAL
jgi:hypothetical protein